MELFFFEQWKQIDTAFSIMAAYAFPLVLWGKALLSQGVEHALELVQ